MKRRSGKITIEIVPKIDPIGIGTYDVKVILPPMREIGETKKSIFAFSFMPPTSFFRSYDARSSDAIDYVAARALERVQAERIPVDRYAETTRDGAWVIRKESKWRSEVRSE